MLLLDRLVVPWSLVPTKLISSGASEARRRGTSKSGLLIAFAECASPSRTIPASLVRETAMVPEDPAGLAAGTRNRAACARRPRRWILGALAAAMRRLPQRWPVEE